MACTERVRRIHCPNDRPHIRHSLASQPVDRNVQSLRFRQFRLPWYTDRCALADFTRPICRCLARGNFSADYGGVGNVEFGVHCRFGDSGAGELWYGCWFVEDSSRTKDMPVVEIINRRYILCHKNYNARYICNAHRSQPSLKLHSNAYNMCGMLANMPTIRPS